MRLKPAAAVLTLALAGCGSTATAHHATPSTPPPAPTVAPTTPASVTADARACRAFRRAITKGVPASAAGEDTMTWLQSQVSSAADPALIAAVNNFAAAWQTLTPRRIAKAQRAVKRACASIT